MNGFAEIYLYKNNNEIYSHKETNMVTNYANELIDVLKTSLETGGRNYSNSFLFDISNNFQGFNTLFKKELYGIALFSEELNEESDKLISFDIKPLGYAGDSISNPTSEIGTLNSEETSYITNSSGKNIGCKFVWDFPTNSCNGIIKSICLIPRVFQNSSITKNSIITKDLASAFFSYEGKATKSLSYLGEYIISSNTGFKISKSNELELTDEGIDKDLNSNYEEFTFDEYSDFYKIIDDSYNNKYITIAKGVVSDLFELITIDKETLNITSIHTLDNIGNFTFHDFGLLGNNYIIFYDKRFDGRSKIYSYNMDTKELNVIPNTGITSTGDYNQSFNIISTVLGINGEYMCNITQHRPYYYYTRTYYNHVTLWMENEEIKSQKIDSTSSSYIPCINLGLTPLCLYLGNLDYNSSSKKGTYQLNFDKRALFTINNLENPVEKTEANTMKIAYTLMWDN